MCIAELRHNRGSYRILRLGGEIPKFDVDAEGVL